MTNPVGKDEALDEPYRKKYIYATCQLATELKFILKLETIIGNQRKELKRLNDIVASKS